MNTLTILDANTSIIPEGLYLELANALKKDFDDKEYNVLELHFKLEGFADGFPECLFDCNSALRYLKKQCDNMDIVKEVFDVYFKDSMYYDIEDDEIIWFNQEDSDDDESDDDCETCCLCCNELIDHDGYTSCETCNKIVCYRCDRNTCLTWNWETNQPFTCWACDIKNFILN